MCFKKSSKKVNTFKFSNEAVEFIQEYLLRECNVTSAIDDDLLEKFISIALDWESMTVDEHGNYKNYDYPEKKRNELADRFVSEVSGKLSDNVWKPDLDDLNKKLGLI